MRVSRTATVILGLSATAAAVDPPGTIIVLYSFRAVVITTAFLVPVYAAVFWTRLEGRAVLTAITGGGLVGLATDIMGGGIGSIPSTFLGMGTGALLLLLGHAVFRGKGPGQAAVTPAPSVREG
jgi:sodium/proline symporter